VAEGVVCWVKSSEDQIQYVSWHLVEPVDQNLRIRSLREKAL
jgi:hypothetical protein